jgi:hypothetical protein
LARADLERSHSTFECPIVIDGSCLKKCLAEGRSHYLDKLGAVRGASLIATVLPTPRIDAKLIPMNSFDGASPVERDRSRIAGIIMARALEHIEAERQLAIERRNAEAECRLRPDLRLPRRGGEHGN